MRLSQIERLNNIKAKRNNVAVKASLEALTQAASSGEGNLLELAVAAARVRATLGEISDALELVFENGKPFQG